MRADLFKIDIVCFLPIIIFVLGGAELTLTEDAWIFIIIIKKGFSIGEQYVYILFIPLY